MRSTTLAIFLCLLALAVAKQHHRSHGDCKTLHEGCNIERGQCACGSKQGCSSPYVYKNEHQCHKDLKGEYDKCKRHPCVHGQCVQMKQGGVRRWHCSCSGSGFYGKKCDIECPIADKDNLPVDFPTDCIY
ncbi:hypothetical protein CAPTEDRAFT_224801 [Capitella teleta]|uniref:EGF-like domain-containing protein n=1 Tax=Capitella teleta TaxID=283909 RepID=R7V506_CAPTE|nr:hypothetical protein CAPTEDRAFT_224801 [Capitella teleta]|eukprot:ELU13634.1 hypothetical protein CAPTEDRAFT_224801 [Capitella teleta]